MPDKEWLYPNLHENGYTYSALENLHYIPHVHGGLECVYVLDGELCATIDEKNYTLKKGDICLIFPQVRHSYRTPNHSNIFCFALLHDTTPDDLRSLFVDGYALPNPIYRAGSYSPLIPEIIDHMLMPEERKANRLVHTGRLLMLLGLLFDARAHLRAETCHVRRRRSDAVPAREFPRPHHAHAGSGASGVVAIPALPHLQPPNWHGLQRLPEKPARNRRHAPIGVHKQGNAGDRPRLRL